MNAEPSVIPFSSCVDPSVMHAHHSVYSDHTTSEDPAKLLYTQNDEQLPAADHQEEEESAPAAPANDPSHKDSASISEPGAPKQTVIREDAPVFVPRNTAAVFVPAAAARRDPPQLVALPSGRTRNWSVPTNWAEAPEFVPKGKCAQPRIIVYLIEIPESFLIFQSFLLALTK